MISILPLGSRRNTWRFAAVTLLSAGGFADVVELTYRRIVYGNVINIFCCTACFGPRPSRSKRSSKCAGATTVPVVE